MTFCKNMLYFQKGYIIKDCRNCKREVVKKITRCPYCGIMNPTLTLKDIFVSIFGIIVIMAVVTYFSN